MKTLRLIPLILLLLILAPPALAQTTGGQESPATQPLNINLNSPVTVSLSTSAAVLLNYKASANETVSVTARALEENNPVDPILTITDASGAELATNDDHRTNRTDLAPRDSLIDGFTFPSAGRFTITVTAFDGAGDVEILISDSTGSNTPVAQTLGDDVIDGEVPDDGTYTHEITASEGEVLTITVRATDNQLDPKVSLVDASGSVLTDNDDHTSVNANLSPYDAEITGFTIPANGTYTIEITAFAGIGGAFELTISRGEGSGTQVAQPTPVPNTTSDTTQVIEGTIQPNDFETYSFTAEAGDIYTITAQALNTSLDPRISLYFNNSYVTDNDDYGSNDPDLRNTDARLYNLLITESGEYEIDVSGYQDTSGDFRLTIQRVATGVSTAAPDEQIELATVNPGRTFTFDFDAQAGDFVTISARGLSFNADAYLALLDSAGTVLIDNDDQGGSTAYLSYYDAQINNFIIETSGTYTVELSSVGDDPATFGLTIGIRR